MRLIFIMMLSLLFVPILISAATVPGSGSGSGNYSSFDVVLLFLYIILALLFSFLCSIAEAVLLNITASYIADLEDKDKKFIDQVKKIRQTEIDRSLAAILTMNTIAHTVGAIGSGAKATLIFGSVWFGLFSAVITLMILFLSEIIPKTIGVLYWRRLVGPVILYIQILIIILYPLIWVAEIVTRLITKDKKVHVFSRDEFVAMAGVGEESGEIKEGELKIIQNLFRLGSLTVESIYTPRTVMMTLDQDQSVNDVLEQNESLPFSRIMIYEGVLDKIVGFVLKDDLLLKKAQDQGNMQIKELRLDISAVSIKSTLSKLLEHFLQNNQQIALVVDEFGIKGLVTIEDVLETLLGIEIVDETDDVDDMRAHAMQVWKEHQEVLGIEETQVIDQEESLAADKSEDEIVDEIETDKSPD